MMRPLTPTADFHPHIREWFADAFSEPTDVQAKAWPPIADGQHVMITAPTGSGKTLTAFLWALNQLITGNWSTGGVRVLYVSPLKALNADIQRNLCGPLAALRKRFEAASEACPDINVQTRSGDTSSSARQRMLRQPPEILITTPESLNILLTTQKGKQLFCGLRTVILDEIHAVAGSKRGTHLITAVDRLVRIAGEFQRIALSATVRPLEDVARFVGGYCRSDDMYMARPVTIIRSEAAKRYELSVTFPADARERMVNDSWWPALVDDILSVIKAHRSTVIFTNNRQLCERLTLMLNTAASERVAYAHHGSLSRELRLAVEAQLKAGKLSAIVATSSLELGIDIGALDSVVLVQAPMSIATAVQRLGRAGHAVGAVSCGQLLPTHGRDFLDSAVLARAVCDHDIEPIRLVVAPLDVLAQVIVSMVATETWTVDDLYAELLTSTPYRSLERAQFDRVLDMLAGRYADSRLRELRARVAIDRCDNTVRARRGAVAVLFCSGGTIPDRGYFRLRRSDNRGLIGELDEEFVWERQVGDTFVLGTQAWRIEQITDSDVLVTPGDAAQAGAPFWKAEAMHRDFHFSERIANVLEAVDGRVDTPQFVDELESEYQLDAVAARELAAFLQRQRSRTGVSLPHRHHLVIEHYDDVDRPQTDTERVILHTGWGGPINRPFAAALAGAWQARHGHRLDTFANNDCIVLELPHGANACELLTLVAPDTVETMLRQRLEQTGYFGARFRENAARALLLSKQRFGQRLPLWLNRLRARKLLDAVMQYDDFPILAETWRQCLHDEFDLPQLKQLLTELVNGKIRWSECFTTTPSPFAASLVWNQINLHMYEDDTPRSNTVSRLRDDLISDVLRDANLRPAISAELADEFRQKLQRVAPGYAPTPDGDLVEWVKDRQLIPKDEWNELVIAIERDHGAESTDRLESVCEKLAVVQVADTSALITACELLPLMAQVFADTAEPHRCWTVDKSGQVGEVRDWPTVIVPDDVADDALTQCISQWLQFYGPIPVSRVRASFGLSSRGIQSVIDTLVGNDAVIVGLLVAGTDVEHVCDAENMERLLRLTRARRRPDITPKPFADLAPFLADYHGLVHRETTRRGLERCLDRLFGYPLPAALWETAIFPARVVNYQTHWLDELMDDDELMVYGCDKSRVVLIVDELLDIVDRPSPTDLADVGTLFPATPGRFRFIDLLAEGQRSVADLTQDLWAAFWSSVVTNDSFQAVRRGVLSGFRPATDSHARQSRPSTQSRRRRWRSSSSMPGRWYLIPWRDAPDDHLECAEVERERVRVLLDRYGILFRELLLNEAPAFQWRCVFRALRVMELSGEVVAGSFFDGIPGVQFIAPSLLPRLCQDPIPDCIFWINACDPISLCGCPLPALRGTLPRRVAGTHLVYDGTTVVLVSQRQGKQLTINCEADNPRCERYLEVFNTIVSRSFMAVDITIETINDVRADKSPFLSVFQAAFQVSVDYKRIKVWRSVDGRNRVD